MDNHTPSPALDAAHAAARRLLALAGRPPSFERIAQGLGLAVIQWDLADPEYFGSYVVEARALLLNAIHSPPVQHATLAELLMLHALPGHDPDTIRLGTLHLLAPSLDWPSNAAAPGTLVPLAAHNSHESPLVLETDARYNIIYASPEAIDWLGFSFEDYRGRNLAPLVRPEDHATLADTEPGLAEGVRAVVGHRRNSYAGVHRMQLASGAEWLTVTHIVRAPRGGVMIHLAPLMLVQRLDRLLIGRLVRHPPG